MAAKRTFKTETEQVVFTLWESLSKLAQNLYTVEEIAARRQRGKATTFVEAINEIITPDEVLGKNSFGEEVVIGHQPNKYRGTYSLYSQRAYDQGNCGDPQEYTGIKISFKAKEIAVNIDSHWGNIQGFGKGGEKYQLSLGKTVMERLDDIGEALWADWTPEENICEKLREVEEDQMWSYDDDYFYMQQKTWSRATDERNYSRLETQFERDCRGGIKYTNRKDDPQAGRPYNRAMFLKYREVLEDQLRLQKEVAQKEIMRKKYCNIKPDWSKKDKRWSNLTEEEKAAALAAYRAKKADEKAGK